MYSTNITIIRILGMCEDVTAHREGISVLIKCG